MERRVFQYPTTRYSGSKRKFLDWIWSHVRDLKFESVLDVFGGTGSVSLLFKLHGKRVFYNDLLKFNQIIGIALIENSKIKVSGDDLKKVLTFNGDYPDFIKREFKDIFFLDEENAWLDKIVTNISRVKDRYKRSILMAGLFQACLAKRPFNLFHRANLYIRTNSVKRSFGNKTTWERPFPELFVRYVNEYNKAIFSNGRGNKVIGGFDAISAPNNVDLVYMDPPYFSYDSTQGTNYLAFYHFLEGLSDYKTWHHKINHSRYKTKTLPDTKEIHNFTKKTEIYVSFMKLIENFQNNIIVLSYRDEGLPSKDEIIEIIRKYKKKIRVFEKEHRYALSRKIKKELLFIAK
ncbi:MAG: DNA adenine methylase [Candidatus Brocadia sp.]